MELEEWMVGEEILEGVPPHLYTNDSDQQGLHTLQICSGLVGLQDFCKDDCSVLPINHPTMICYRAILVAFYEHIRYYSFSTYS